MKITNTQAGPRGVNTKAGPMLVEPGQTIEADLEPAELAVARKTGWFQIDGAGAKVDAKAPAPVTGMSAVHRGRGSYSIMDGDNEALEGLTKAEADAFNALSDEEKAKFLADRKV